MRNVGNLDRVLRVVLGIVAAIVASSSAGAAAIALWVVGAVLVATGVVGFCPIYRVLHLSSRRHQL